jgi:hypothetical protein
MNKIIQKPFGVIILIYSLKNLKDSLIQMEMQLLESIWTMYDGIHWLLFFLVGYAYKKWSI